MQVATEAVTVETLKEFEALKSVPDDQLQWLIDHCENRFFGDMEKLSEPGKPLEGPHFIISGKMRLFMPTNYSKREIGDFGPGDITGYLPFSRGRVSKFYTKSIGELHLLTLPDEHMQEMIRTQFELTEALVHVMSTRVRDYTAMQQQNEKMMALGKLSAGLTHELNNPASAIVRDSLSLKKQLGMSTKTFKKLTTIRIGDEDIDAVNDKLFGIIEHREPVKLSLRQRTALEEELGEWLTDRNVDEGYEFAANMVEFNFCTKDLEEFGQHIPEEHFAAVFGWINNNLVVEKMVEDILEAASRISNLVNSVKNFTHMDRGEDKQFADIHQGIRNTITMLGYKLKKGNITLVEEYDETLPPVKALIGELNQVWTNIIDNAIDAMAPNGGGTLTIKTGRDREFVQVFIEDTGVGIPEESIGLIFDPFFTTKEMGKGTGMGLEVVQRIVKQHHGSVKVTSEPGHTSFEVCFPING